MNKIFSLIKSKVKLFADHIAKQLNLISIPQLILSVLIGAFAGWILNAFFLSNIALVIVSALVVFDLLYTGFVLNKKDLLLGKITAYGLLSILGRGIPAINPNWAVVFGIGYYSLTEIINSVTEFYKRIKENKKNK